MSGSSVAAHERRPPKSRRRGWIVAIAALVVAGVVVAVSIPDAEPPDRFWANDFDYTHRLRLAVGGAPIDGWSFVRGMARPQRDADRYNGIIADAPAFAWLRVRLGLPAGSRRLVPVRVVGTRAIGDERWTEFEIDPDFNFMRQPEWLK